MKHVLIYADGACEHNPGPGGYAAILKYDQSRQETSGGFRLTTNNRMEIYAAIAGLQLLQEPCQVRLYSDSRYLVDAMSLGWVPKWKSKNWWRSSKERAVNIDLWERLLGICQKQQVTFIWVEGHAGDVDNERCDRLSYAAIRQNHLQADEGYENKPEAIEPPKAAQEGQPCPRCSTALVRRKSRKFHNPLYCPNCQASYQLETGGRETWEINRLF